MLSESPTGMKNQKKKSLFHHIYLFFSSLNRCAFAGAKSMTMLCIGKAGLITLFRSTLPAMARKVATAARNDGNSGKKGGNSGKK
jgi:hypothetical protein